MESKRVLVLSTGGTIASVRGSDGRNVAGTLTGQQLVDKLPVPVRCQVEVQSIFQKPSNALSLDDLLVLGQRCQEAAGDPDLAGIVVTHGTDTLEDTAYFLQSSLPAARCPVVITGSQRPPHVIGTDAYANLGSAIRVAADPVVQGMGVLVVFNETIFSAEHVRKVSSFQLNGFDAPGVGPLGYVDGDRVVLPHRPHRPDVVAPAAHLPRVDIVTVCLGGHPAQLLAAADSGAQGLVIEAMGRGHVPPDWMPAIAQLRARGLPIAVVTSCLSGPLFEAYAFPGCLRELEDLGVIALSDLSARKARLRLALMLSNPAHDAASRPV